MSEEKVDLKLLTKAYNFPVKPTFDTELIKVSALLRIADSLEIVAKDYQEIHKSKIMYQKKYQQATKETEKLRQSIAGHKAAYTKLKNKVENEVTITKGHYTFSEKQLAEIAEVISSMDQCRFDSNGDCQEHCFFNINYECPVEFSQNLVNEYLDQKSNNEDSR